jgi:hypothetical protein
MGRAAGCPANERWVGGDPNGDPNKDPAGRGAGPIGIPGRTCVVAGRGPPRVRPEPVEPGGGVGAEPGVDGARFTGIGCRGPESTCPGRGEPAAGIGRGGGGTGRPGAAGESVEAVRSPITVGRGAPTGG